MVVMVVALLLTVCVATYLYVARRLGPQGPGGGRGEPTRDAISGELTMLLTLLLGSLLLILLFAIGAYLVLRAGRSLSRNQAGSRPTEYVDAWSKYRLSEEQIKAATDEDRPGPRPQRRRDAPDAPPEPDGPPPPRED